MNDFIKFILQLFFSACSGFILGRLARKWYDKNYNNDDN